MRTINEKKIVVLRNGSVWCVDKMASSLTADSFFNLSTQQQQKTNYNKEYIYVKLTDSALRAIEEFLKNQVGTKLQIS